MMNDGVSQWQIVHCYETTRMYYSYSIREHVQWKMEWRTPTRPELEKHIEVLILGLQWLKFLNRPRRDSTAQPASCLREVKQTDLSTLVVHESCIFMQDAIYHSKF